VQFKDMGLTISDDFIDEDEIISNESRVISPVSTPVSMPSLKSIGPPKILKYHPESKKKELIAPLPENRIEADTPEDVLQFFKEFNVYLKGGNVCEFCSQTTLPWPSIQEQETGDPTNVNKNKRFKILIKYFSIFSTKIS
jgi:hypothetical protein